MTVAECVHVFGPERPYVAAHGRMEGRGRVDVTALGAYWRRDGPAAAAAMGHGECRSVVALLLAAEDADGCRMHVEAAGLRVEARRVSWDCPDCGSRWPACIRCGALSARTLGSEPVCGACAEVEVSPIRERVRGRRGAVDVVRSDDHTVTPGGFDGVGVIAGRRRDEYGPGVFDLRCDRCGAGWSGVPGDPCGWCERARRRLIEAQRAALLFPDWLATSAGDVGYDELGDEDRVVWDVTRGQARGSGSLSMFAHRLARAVECGLVSEVEALQAWGRVFGDG